jgi:hypothetical protein
MVGKTPPAVHVGFGQPELYIAGAMNFTRQLQLGALRLSSLKKGRFNFNLISFVHCPAQRENPNLTWADKIWTRFSRSADGIFASSFELQRLYNRRSRMNGGSGSGRNGCEWSVNGSAANC